MWAIAMEKWNSEKHKSENFQKRLIFYMVLSTPLSALRLAPFVANDNGLAR